MHLVVMSERRNDPPRPGDCIVHIPLSEEQQEQQPPPPPPQLPHQGQHTRRENQSVV